MFSYRTKGICAPYIHLQLDGDRIESVEFVGGCDGNLKAIASLVKGMTVDQVTTLLAGNTCETKSTSCADQLTLALQAALVASDEEK